MFVVSPVVTSRLPSYTESQSGACGCLATAYAALHGIMRHNNSFPGLKVGISPLSISGIGCTWFKMQTLWKQGCYVESHMHTNRF